MAIQTVDNKYGVAKWIVDPVLGRGTHTTIATALSAASSGDTIFIRPGTYTENLTLKAGVDLAAFECDALTPNVTIVGNATFSLAGFVSISGIRLQTNGSNLLTVGGTAATVLSLINCFLNCTNSTGISFTTTNVSATVQLYRCGADLGTTGIALHSMSSTGSISYSYCIIGNSGATTTVTSNSAGTCFFQFCFMNAPIGSTSTGSNSIGWSSFNSSAQNVTTYVITGSGTNGAQFCSFFSGSATAISLGAGTTNSINSCDIISNNATAAISGTGTITGANLQMIGSGNVIAAGLTQIGRPYSGYVGPATSATGWLGEQISSVVTGVNLPNGSVTNITSINITPGTWNVTCLTDLSYSGTSNSMEVGISPTSATFTGIVGDQNTIIANTVGTGRFGLAVPNFRVVLSATTTYYLVGQGNFTGGACTANGRLSATRVT